MLSKGKLKFIRSLEMKKHRKEEQAFVAEGPKIIHDLDGHFACKLLLATSAWIESQASLPQAEEIIEVTPEELSRASFLKTPQEVMAVYALPQTTLRPDVFENELTLALDDVQDPGNLGTIIRLADWFGIRHIFCSPGTADGYNPKVVQATMGAIARVQLHYQPLLPLLEELNQRQIPIYGTFLDGENMYEKKLSNHGIIVMGNEGNGISPLLRKKIDQRLYIPNYPTGVLTSESLNVATATAIICAEFRRRQR